MKKFILLIFILIFALTLASCGDDGLDNFSNSSSADNSGADSSANMDNNDNTQYVKIEERGSVVLDENASLGYLSGKLLIDKNEKSYEVYFGNNRGKLAKYTKVGDCENGELLLDGVVVPPEATTMIFIGGDEQYLVKIPEKCLLNGKNAYIFGALSDVHYNKYYSDGTNDDAVFAFNNALDYFDEIGADLVAITGDLTNDGEEDSLIKYSEAIEGRSFPVYTTTGNHDMNAYNNGLWQKYITDNIKNCEFAPNGLDYAYTSEETDDMFIFFNISKYSYSDKAQSVVWNKQLEWLENTLEANTDKQIYLFFHLFMCGPDGEYYTGVGNIMNPGGYTYPLPFKYGNSDERRFRRLMKENKNVVYFSGHSHWMFEMEIYGEDTNFSNFDGEYCTMVHIPGVTEPRYIGEYDTDRTGKNGVNSQGWAIYDYGEVRILVPIDFITGTIYTEYMEIIK